LFLCFATCLNLSICIIRNGIALTDDDFAK